MNVTVLLFASLADRAGLRRVEVPFEPGDTVEQVRDRLFARFPDLRRFVSTLLYALNEDYVTPDTAVAPGDTVAFIPPVSGGC